MSDAENAKPIATDLIDVDDDLLSSVKLRAGMDKGGHITTIIRLPIATKTAHIVYGHMALTTILLP